MAERRIRAQDLVEESRYWDAEDLIRNLEAEMQKLEQGLGQVIFDSEGRAVTMCVSPLPVTPSFEMKEGAEEFSLRVRLPGVDKEDVRLYLSRNAIDVRAVSGKRICRPFFLSVDTPWSIDLEDAIAEFEDGILSVKTRRLKKTRVPVK